MRLRSSGPGRAFAALLLAAAPAVATPAYADAPADLTVLLTGPASAAGAGPQVVTATVVNQGRGTANGVTLRYTGQVDSEAVDPATVRFCGSGRRDGRPEWASRSAPPAAVPSLTAPVWGSCPLPDLAPGHSHGLRSSVLGRANTHGEVGELTVEVGHAGTDPTPADNTATTRLRFADPVSYRLYARGWDGPVDQSGKVVAVPPGGTGDLQFEIGNSGDAPVNGFTVTIQLPRQAAFEGSRPGCAYARDRQSATCVYGDLPVMPARTDTDPADRSYSALRFRHRFSVDRAAPARARLDDGLLRVEPMVTGYLPPPVTRLPDGWTGLRARDFRDKDDWDRLVILTRSHAGDGAGLGDDDTPGAGLPVTGVRVGVLGLVGFGLAVLGAALVLIGRRRPGPRPTDPEQTSA